jgi:cob(II)yrinic acid a,c-diamide reductase
LAQVLALIFTSVHIKGCNYNEAAYIHLETNNRTDVVLMSTAIDPQDYRAAMRQFPAAVHIATTNGAAGKRGITVSAATSVSDKPATLLICVNRDHAHNHLFKDNGCFALNTLALDQIAIARAFADGKMSLDERFAHGEWDVLSTGAPCLNDAAVIFDCEIIDSAEMATHTVLYGRVKAMRVEEAKGNLLYANRHYRGLGSIIE